MKRISMKMLKANREWDSRFSVMRKRASAAEKRWLQAKALDKDLSQKGNSKDARARKRAECPPKSMRAEKYRRFRDKALGKLGAASTVRRVSVAEG